MKRTDIHIILLPVLGAFAACAFANAWKEIEGDLRRALPKTSPAEFAEIYHARHEYYLTGSLPRPPIDRFPGAPGYGHSGTILPYKDTPGLREKREHYNLSAGWFVRDPIPPDSPEGEAISSRDSDSPARYSGSVFLALSPACAAASRR